MSSGIVECVPNISEGRDIEKINRIVDAARIEGDVKVIVDYFGRADSWKMLITITSTHAFF